jgi:PKD repeat protein
MRASSWLRIVVGILFILIFVQGVQAAPKPPTPPAETYSLVKTLPFDGIPWGIAVDGSHGWIYIADHQASYIYKFDTAGNPLLSWPSVNWGLAVDSNGNVYTDGVNETNYDNIYIFDPFGNRIRNISTELSSGNRGLDIDSEGNIYVAERDANKVRKYTPTGVLTTWSPNSNVIGPEGIAVNDSKWVYVTDLENHRIQRFDYTTGRLDSKWTLSDFSNRNGKFSGAEGIVVDDAGNIFITDQSNKNAQKYYPDGTLITSWGSYNNPVGIDVDQYGNVYVLDSTGILVYTSSANPIKAAFITDPTPAEGTVPLTVYFTDHSTGASTYLWDFGDGSTITPDNYYPSPTHTYINAGSYTAKLTINGNEVLFQTKVITVKKANAAVSVSGWTGPYDATAHGATGTATGVGGVDLKSQLDLGQTYTDVPGGVADWKFNGGTNYNDQSGSVNIVINKKDAAVSVSGWTGPYDATAHGATGTATGVGGVDLKSQLDLGQTYTDVPGGVADWKFNGGTNYNDQSGSVNIVINKKDATVSVSGWTGAYDATAHGATGTATGLGGVDLSSSLNLGSTFTDVPGGTAHWTFAGGISYADKSGDVAITINKADQDINFGPLSDKTYSDLPFEVSAEASSGLSVSFSTTSAACSVSGTTVTINEAGDCTITASQSGDDNYNAAPDVSQTFTINEQLAAKFSATPRTVQAGQNVQFTDESTGIIVKWEWDFGNGQKLVYYTPQTPPVQTYLADEGTGGERFYDVSLTVTDDKGSTSTKTETQYITVTPLNNNIVADAVRAAENQFLGGSTDGLVVYASDEQLDPNTPVNGWSYSHEVPSSCPMVNGVPDEPVLVFIDYGITEEQIPVKDTNGDILYYKTVTFDAQWEHDCAIHYYCPLSQSFTGELTLSTCTSPVTIGSDEEPLAYADGNVPTPEGYTPQDPYPWDPGCANDCSKQYALLISGGKNRDYNNQRYWNDISFVFNTLIEYGYDRTHIKVLMSDGSSNELDQKVVGGYANSSTKLEGSSDTTVDVTGAADLSNLTNTLNNWGLPTDASLFIFMTGHGGNVSNTNNVLYYLYYNQTITDADFVKKIDALDIKNITLVMEQCYGGGFKEEFIDNPTDHGVNQKRVLITAANWNEPSWANGFSNAWTMGVAGHDRDNVLIDLSADLSKDQRVSNQESYDYGKANDPFAKSGKEHPQIFSRTGTGTDPLTRFLTECTIPVPKTITAKVDSTKPWTLGSYHYIYWQTTGLPTTGVNISIKNTTFQYQIATNVSPLTRSYRWLIPYPSTWKTATDYTIKIEAVGLPAVSGSSASFTLKPYATNGNVWVNTTPTGAAITRDLVGSPTNKLFSSQKPGEYLIKVDLDKYLPKYYVVPISGGGAKTGVSITLTSSEGQSSIEETNAIDIDSTPQGARIFIDGVDTFLKTPAMIDVSKSLTHEVKVMTPCFESEPQFVYVPEYTDDGSVPHASAFFELPLCYQFEGFGSPVVMNTLNTANAGKALPLKWHLSDTGGQNIDDRQSFISVQSRNITCPGSPIVQTDNAIENFTGASNLRNSGYGNWSFNVDIPRRYKGTCRSLSVLFNTTLVDGSIQRSPEVEFKFS